MGTLEISTLVFATTSLVLCVLYCGAILRAHKAEIQHTMESMERDHFESYDRMRTLLEKSETNIGVRISEIERQVASLDNCPKNSTKSR